MSKKIKMLFLGLISLLLTPAASRALDQESIQCLGCHDAGTATDVTLEVCTLPECDHPLGVDYVLLSATNRGLKSPALLPPGIRLVGNSIGCGTCHVPYQSSDHAVISSLRNLYPEIADPMLVMDNRKSELCFGCHLK